MLKTTERLVQNMRSPNLHIFKTSSYSPLHICFLHIYLRIYLRKHDYYSSHGRAKTARNPDNCLLE